MTTLSLCIHAQVSFMNKLRNERSFLMCYFRRYFKQVHATSNSSCDTCNHPGWHPHLYTSYFRQRKCLCARNRICRPCGYHWPSVYMRIASWYFMREQLLVLVCCRATNVTVTYLESLLSRLVVCAPLLLYLQTRNVDGVCYCGHKCYTGKTTEALHRHGRHSVDRFSQNATRTKPSTRAWEVASHSSIKIVAS